MVKEAIVKRHPRIAESRRPQVELVREALGAIAARLPAVFWLYIDCDGRWSVRREGALNEEKFGSQDAALEFLELEAARCSSYRLFVQRSDGRISEESFNWVTAA